jgi:hypothetical protein
MPGMLGERASGLVNCQISVGVGQTLQRLPPFPVLKKQSILAELSVA